MPSYVIVQSGFGRIGETIEATLCDSGVAGFPDRRTDVPVRVRLVSERVLSVDDDPHGIIWSQSGNGVTTFLVDGSTMGLRNRERRVALARASDLLTQLAAALKPLAAESEAPELTTEGLGLLFNWISRERERATTAGAPKGVPHDYAS